ncbi:MAG: hypothetical protein HYX74_09340 [Acidobacteria bacterium]|nr:hypothetical protein [Acidobacteriota bacterium]
MKAGVRREKGYVYFLDREGDIARSRIGQRGRMEKVAKIGLQREKGFLYFVDSQGDISRALMQRRKEARG